MSTSPASRRRRNGLRRVLHFRGFQQARLPRRRHRRVGSGDGDDRGNRHIALRRHQRFAHAHRRGGRCRRAGRGHAPRLPGVVVLVAPPARRRWPRPGYHAVAPDLRGYGQTGGPQDAGQYTNLHLVGDVVGLIAALGADPVVVVGHDWGAPLAWNTALLRPDLVRGVAGLSVPYVPRGDVDLLTTMSAAHRAQQLSGVLPDRCRPSRAGGRHPGLRSPLRVRPLGRQPDATDLSIPAGIDSSQLPDPRASRRG